MEGGQSRLQLGQLMQLCLTAPVVSLSLPLSPPALAVASLSNILLVRNQPLPLLSVASPTRTPPRAATATCSRRQPGPSCTIRTCPTCSCSRQVSSCYNYWGYWGIKVRRYSGFSGYLGYFPVTLRPHSFTSQRCCCFFQTYMARHCTQPTHPCSIIQTPAHVLS